MKVLMINGSANERGCTFTALSEVGKPLQEQGIETEIIQLGKQAYRDCIGCMACKKLDNKCVFDDDIVNRIIEKARQSDGFVFGSPVYFAHPSGRLLSVLNRVFLPAAKSLLLNRGLPSYRRAARERPPRLTLLTNILITPACPLFRLLIGTWCTAIRPQRSCRTKKGCKQCAIWDKTWPGC